jgi:hypothetical protein
VDELYPGLTLAGFPVDGYAVTQVKDRPQAIPKAGRIGVDIPQFLGGLTVTNLRSVPKPDGVTVTTHEDPTFRFPLLTTKFFSDAIHADGRLEVSLAQKGLGEVTYVSGAGAQDYSGDVSQAIASLHAQGELNETGLDLAMKGDFGDAVTARPAVDRFMQSSYDIRMLIPWHSLRFILHDQRNFLLTNHLRLKRTASA